MISVSGGGAATLDNFSSLRVSCMYVFELLPVTFEFFVETFEFHVLLFEMLAVIILSLLLCLLSS